MDSGNLILNDLTELQNFVLINGIYSATSSGDIKKWTHPKTIKYFNCTWINENNRNGACIGFNTNINLVKEWPLMPPFDLILMRNILIYFNQEKKQRVITKMKAQLAGANSTLLLGASESMLFDHSFKLHHSNKISYYLSNFIQNNVPSDFKLGFNSELFKEILSVNKDADNAKLCINLEGLMKLEFETESTKSTYYIVSKEI